MDTSSETPEELNPYRSPAPVDEVPIPPPDLGEAGQQFDVVDLLAKRAPWVVTLFVDHLKLESSQPLERMVAREEISRDIQVNNHLITKRSLTVKVAGKKRVLQFSPVGFEALLAWLGPPTAEELKGALSSRTRVDLLVGGLFIVLSFRWGAILNSSLFGLSVEPSIFSLGIALVLVWIVAKFLPHRSLFLVESALYGCLATGAAIVIVTGDFSWFSVVALIFLILAVYSRINQFRKYRGIR